MNLSGLEGQVESGVIWGLSYALKGEITYASGRVEQRGYFDRARDGGRHERHRRLPEAARVPIPGITCVSI